MKKYLLNEVKGKYYGEMLIVEAENAEEACRKAGAIETIKPYERFKSFLGKIYKCYELGKTWKVERIARIPLEQRR